MAPHERKTCADPTRTCPTPDTLSPKLCDPGRRTQPLQTQKAELVVSYLFVFRSICTVPPLYAFVTACLVALHS